MPVDLLTSLPKPDRDLALQLGFLESWLSHPHAISQLPAVLLNYRNFRHLPEHQRFRDSWLNVKRQLRVELDYWSTYPLTDVGAWASKRTTLDKYPFCCEVPIRIQIGRGGRLLFKNLKEHRQYDACQDAITLRRQRFMESFERIHVPKPSSRTKLVARLTAQQSKLSPFKRALVNLRNLPHDTKCKALRMGYSRSWMNHPERVAWVRSSVHCSGWYFRGHEMKRRARPQRLGAPPEIEFWVNVGAIPNPPDRVGL